jgi:hypothetical protein
MNSNALKARLVLLGKTVDDIITELNCKKNVKLSRESFYRKMKGTSDFTRKEILALSELLVLTDNDIMDIFFNEMVS